MFFSAMSKVFDKQLKEGDVLAHSWGGMVDQDQLMWQKLFCHGSPGSKAHSREGAQAKDQLQRPTGPSSLLLSDCPYPLKVPQQLGNSI